MAKTDKKLFLFLNHDPESDEQIGRLIEQNKLCSLQRFDNVKESFERIKKGNVSCFVLNLKVCDVNIVNILVMIKDLPKCPQIIVLAAKVTNEAYEASVANKRIAIIEKPFGEKELSRLCQKIMDEEDIVQREHKRFYTEQPVNLDKMPNGGACRGHIYNLSKGGGYLEISQGSLAVGDIYKMTVQAVGKTRVFYGQVVWTTTLGPVKNLPGAGVRFIKEDDVYTSLIEKL